MRITMIIVTLFIGVLVMLWACTRPAPAPSALPASVPAPEPTAVQMTSEVLISGREYQPSVITVSAGTKVTWKSQDGERHTITSATGLFSGTLELFGSFSYTFNERGTFEYSCQEHPYMTGKVVVE